MSAWRPRRGGGAGRRWWSALVVVLVLVVALALAGGFAAARGDAGPAARPGEPVTLERWEITVREVELVDTTVNGSPTTTNLRVHLTAVLTGDESEDTLPDRLVDAVPPDGSSTGRGYQVDQRWGSGLDPDVPRPYVLDLPWPEPDEDGVQAPVTTAPTTVAVVVRDEVYAEGFLFGWSWGVADVAAVVSVPVTDARLEP